MKVAVCTLAINEWYQEIVKYGVRTIENYAKKHGYDFYLCNDVYDGKRDCPWYKIRAIQKVLPDYDFVIWLDADGHVLRPELSIEYFLYSFLGEKDLLCGKEFNCSLNTGVMIVKNTSFIHVLLNLVWDNKQNFDVNFHEQASLCQIYDTNRLNSKEKIEIVQDQSLLFVYWANYYPGHSFFFHSARCSHDPVGFIYTMDTYCPIRMEEDVSGEYEKRVEWLNDEKKCRQDIDICLRTGKRFGMSTRTKRYVEKFLSEKLEEKIGKSKLKKNL